MCPLTYFVPHDALILLVHVIHARTALPLPNTDERKKCDLGQVQLVILGLSFGGNLAIADGQTALYERSGLIASLEKVLSQDFVTKRH